ncbi:MAG: hypothetical protein AAGL17_09420 [Cyanobacteria bacterium J06576_12]
MTLTLDLPTDLEQYLLQEASQKGVSVEDLAVQLLKDLAVSKRKQVDAVNLLQSWIDDGDELEQKETGQFLIEALDEDRLSDRKLFPPEMKGISW